MDITDIIDNTSLASSTLAIRDTWGPTWVECNRYMTLYNSERSISRFDNTMAWYRVILELSIHNGAMKDLSVNAVASFNLGNYDASGMGPVIGGLNNQPLSLTNHFNSQKVQFAEVKAPLLEFASKRMGELISNRPNGR